MRKVNKAGLNLIKSFEGCKLRAYQDSVGVWTIGYGHTKGVKHGDVITQQEADAIFEDDINIFAAGVDRLIEDDVNDNEFAALVSLAFNIGLRNFGRSSLLRLVNRGDFDSAADEFLKWNRAGNKVLKGLTRRRKAERELFLKSDDILRAATVQAMQQSEPVASFSSSNGDATQPLESPTDAPQQTNESGGSGQQVVIQPNALTEAAKPIVSQKDEEPQQATTGGFKSAITSVVGWITGAGAGLVALLKDNQTLLIIAAIIAVIAGLAYFIRQLILDRDRLRIASDPTKYNSK